MFEIMLPRTERHRHKHKHKHIHIHTGVLQKIGNIDFVYNIVSRGTIEIVSVEDFVCTFNVVFR
jgi:hypothetical protein